MISPVRVAFSCFLIILFIVSAPRADSAIRAVAVSGTPAAGGPAGALFDTPMDAALISSTGHVGFFNRMQIGPGGVTVDDRGAIWVASGGSLDMIVRQGSQAPDLPSGATFFQLDLVQPHLNAAGNVAFRATLNQGAGGVDSTNRFGIWSAGGGSLRLVARQGSQAPGTSPGTNFASLADPVMNDAGQVAFTAFLLGSQGLWTGDADSLTLVARTLEQAAGAPLGALYGPFGAVSFNNSEQVAFSGSLNIGTGGVTADNDRAIWSSGAGAGLDIAAREGEQAPGTPAGAVFDSFETTPVINNSGDLAFDAWLKTGTGGVTTSNRTGIWKQHSGTLELVARRGSDAPDGPGGAVLGGGFDPVISDSGAIAFRGSFQLGAGGITEANDEAIFSEGSGTLALVAHEGTQAPGTPAGALFSNSFGPPAINADGRIAFGGFLDPNAGGGVDFSNRTGIWAEDEDYELQLIARAGDQVDLGGGDVRTIGSFIDFFDPFRGFDDDGNVTFAAFFTDGSAGVLISDLVASSDSGPGDFDADGDLDGTDFLTWQRGGSPNATSAADLSTWQSSYGTAAQTLKAVPEPSTAMMITFLLAAAVMSRGDRLTRTSKNRPCL